MLALATSPTITMSSSPATRLAMSPDGRWVALVQQGKIWLEDQTSGIQVSLAARAGRDLAVSHTRVWIAREGTVEYVDLANPALRSIVIDRDFGLQPKLTASGGSIVVTSSDGTWVIRDSLAIIELATRASTVRSLGDDRILVADATDPDAKPMIVDFAGDQPRAMPLAIGARVLDATCLLDRTTAVLLCERDTHQELVVIRNFGTVLSRTRVRKVARIYGASRALVVAMATDDGRVIVFDLRDRRALSVDHPAPEPFPIALAPDGRRLIGWSDGLLVRDLAAC